MHSPTVVNQTAESIVVFLERGILYNKCVLLPGEAVCMTRQQTGGGILIPYYIHAVIGDEKSLPGRAQSVKNLISVAAIPTAFCIGALCASMSGGTSIAATAKTTTTVAKLASSLKAGTLLASRVGVVSELLVQKHPDKFMAKSNRLFPGKRFVTVAGGLEAPLTIQTITQRQFKKLKILAFKEPIDTIQDKINYYIPISSVDSIHDSIHRHVPNLPKSKAYREKLQQARLRIAAADAMTTTTTTRTTNNDPSTPLIPAEAAAAPPPAPNNNTAIAY